MEQADPSRPIKKHFTYLSSNVSNNSVNVLGWSENVKQVAENVLDTGIFFFPTSENVCPGQNLTVGEISSDLYRLLQCDIWNSKDQSLALEQNHSLYI